MTRRSRRQHNPEHHGETRPWVAACYAAIDAAAAGKDPSAAVAHLPELEAERALAAALPIIEKVTWISEKILAEPNRRRRQQLLARHTRKNTMAKPIETRVKRLWAARRASGREHLASMRAACQDDERR